jgi:hypothetical protein
MKFGFCLHLHFVNVVWCLLSLETFQSIRYTMCPILDHLSQCDMTLTGVNPTKRFFFIKLDHFIVNAIFFMLQTLKLDKENQIYEEIKDW